jgi:hypothetical protein
MLDEFVEIKEKELDRLEKQEEEGVPTNSKGKDEDEARDIETLINQWNKDFDRVNPDPEDNSDFDSDNDINPLDTLTPAGKYTSSK